MRPTSLRLIENSARTPNVISVFSCLSLRLAAGPACAEKRPFFLVGKKDFFSAPKTPIF
jgi:hypothetical protein